MIDTIYLAGGCFWGLQKYLKLIYGVIETEVGFANGNTDNPINPLSVKGQGEDKGTRYRTGVYCTEDCERPAIEAVFKEICTGIGEDPAVELLPLKNWFPAEEYHQNYLNNNPDGYCHLREELFGYAKNLKR